VRTRRRALTRGNHDLMHLRRGPLRPLALEPERQLDDPGRRARHHDPRARAQRLKPARTVCANPVSHRRATDPDKPPAWAELLTADKQADQPASVCA
jgi:hypothetical protein